MALNVLIVEDEAIVAVGVRSVIEDIGYNVVGVARSGEEAMIMASESRPDVAIVDVKLPGMNGIDTTKRLVDEYNIIVVILTAFADSEFVGGAAAAGAFAYMLKPITKESLRANLQVVAARAAELEEVKKEADDMKEALETRKIAERAKHVLMERLSLSEGDAFAHMRQKCRNQNKTMREVSDEILCANDAFLASIDKSPPRKIKNG